MPRPEWERSIYRASRLDLFREFQSGELWNGDEFTPEEFITHMTEPETSDAMEAGTALHAVLENAGHGALPDQVKWDGWTICFELDAELPLPAWREIPLSREHRGIVLSGRVDAMDALAVHDLKTTASIDIDRYLDSYQWRAYLWMSGRRHFVYDIFRVIRDEKRRELAVREYVPLPLTWYPRLSADVESLLVEFDAAVTALGIPDIMRKKQMAAYMADPVNLLAAG